METFTFLTLLHSERPKLYGVLTILSAIELILSCRSRMDIPKDTGTSYSVSISLITFIALDKREYLMIIGR